MKRLSESLNEVYEWYDIDNKLKLLKSYYHILGNNPSNDNADLAKTYFRLIYNFLIIERMFSEDIKQANKELNKNLELPKLDNIDDIYNLFLKLYDPDSEVRFAIETFDSVESVRVFIENNRRKIHNTFM
jgi:hypothetical protein